MQIDAVLASNLKRLRKDRGWSQENLALEAGLALTTIKRIETKVNWISPEGIKKIAKAFGCPENELFVDKQTLTPMNIQEAYKVIGEALKINKP